MSRSRFGAFLTVLLTTAAALLLFSEIWAVTTWAGLKMDEILFHLRVPLEGTGGGMIGKYLARCALPAGLVGLSVILMLLRNRRDPAARGQFVKRSIIGALAAAVLCFAVAAVKLDLVQFLMDQMEDSSFIEDNYVDPNKTTLTFPEEKRNLIYIYLESMEMTYADADSGGAFARNVIPELTELSLEGDNFNGGNGLLNGGHVMPGSTYTMGGMFTESTGLPLKVDLGDQFTDQRGSFNKMNTQDSFFSGVTAIGDILKQEGYNQAFMMGSDATFGGRRLFLTEHGDFELCDYKWAVEQGLIPKDYYVFWGFEDQKLFSYAKDKVTELAAQDQPFNFSLLTVDTHFEDGYCCSQCRDDFSGNQYANAMACSSRQVSAFVRWIQEQDFYENTTIVLNGDHLTMDSDFCLNVPSSYDRRTYTAVLNAACRPSEPDRLRQYTTLDLFPTTLAAMGVTIDGDRLGLGTNLYGTQDTLLETWGAEELSSLLSKKSSFMQKLANINIYDEDLLRAQGLAPDSTIRILDTGDGGENGENVDAVTFSVSNIRNVSEKIRYVEARAWDNDDPDHVVQFRLEKADGAGKGKMGTDAENTDQESGTDSRDSTGVYTGTLYGTSPDAGEDSLNLRSCNLYIYAAGKSGITYEIGRVTGDLALKTQSISEYLARLEENLQYSIFVTIRDDGTREITSDMQKRLWRLGLSEVLPGHYRWSYYAVLIPGEKVLEEISQEELSCSGSLPDGSQYSVISQGGLSGAGGGAGRYLTCSVRINDVEYAVQRIGLNFVVYDNAHGCVADSVEFNTYDGLGARRKEPSLQTAD